MDEANKNPKNIQRILTDTTVGRDMTIGNISQTSNNTVILQLGEYCSTYKNLQTLQNSLIKLFDPDGWRKDDTADAPTIDDVKKLLNHIIQNTPNLAQKLTKFIPQEDQQHLKCYLIIVINEKSDLTAWFIPDDDVKDEFTRFIKLDVDDDKTSIVYKYENITKLLSSLIDKCYKDLHKCNYSKNIQLNIEIFLSEEILFTEPVETWKYSDDYCDIKVGKEHRVVVRWYQRLKKQRHHKIIQPWINKGNNIEREKIVITQDKFMTIKDTKCCCDKDKLRSLIAEKKILNVCCISPESAEAKNLLAAIFSAGIPIVLFSRCHIDSTKLEQLLKEELCQLPERVRKQRTVEDEFGDNLVLLWDNPQRIPPSYPLTSLG